ncbi:MAG: protein kinase [Myxococcales bacterium]|nr:protein kinase [Myxococcales bacterium]
MSNSSFPSEVQSPLAKLSGTVLESRYALGRMLGAGGMGAVFEATQLSLDRKVAVKVLRPGFSGHDEFVRRFMREAKVASKISHRNVVEILDFGRASSGLVFLVMKFLRGQNLEEYLRAQPGQRVPWPQACALLAQIAAGLRAAHAEGVIHRDVKPANCILILEDDQLVAKVVDFGIAKSDESDQQLTRTREVLGTPAYIAPELVRTKIEASPRTDTYSLGVLAYRMLTGQVPFIGETTFEVLHRSCFEPVPPLRGWVPDLPAEVEAFVLSLLAKDPNDRPPDMLAVRDGLLALGGDTVRLQLLPGQSSGALAVGFGDTGVPSGSLTTPLPTPSGVPVDVGAAAPGFTQLVSNETVVASPAPPVPRSHATTAPAKASDPAIHTVIAASSSINAPFVPSTPAQDSVGSTYLPIEAPRPRRRALLVVGLIGGLVLGVGAVWLAATSRQDPAAPTSSATPSPERSMAAATPTVAPAVPEVEGEAVEGEDGAGEDEAPKAKPAAPRPPSDRRLLKRLEHRIKTHCADALAGRSIKISFLIQPSGEIFGFSATPQSACVAKQVAGITFSPRAKDKAVKLVVE